MKEPGAHLRATIASQPVEAARILADREPAERAAARLRDARRIFLVGTGTSFHGSLAGEQMLRSIGLDARAVPSFEFAAYPPPERPGDALVLLSHRGTKRFTVSAGEASRAAVQVLITGKGSPMTGDVVLDTVEQEASPVHTAGHTGALLRLAQIAAALDPGGEIDRSLAGIPAAIEAALGTADRCAEVIAGTDLSRPLHFAGAGPGWATALEAALKIREAAFLTAEGHHLEGLLHGPLISLDRADAVFLVAQPGPSLERCSEAAAALVEIGIRVVSVGAAAARLGHPVEAIETPQLPEVLAPLVNVIPFQWLAYHASVKRQVDADSFRRDDARYLAAQARFRL